VLGLGVDQEDAEEAREYTDEVRDKADEARECEMAVGGDGGGPDIVAIVEHMELVTMVSCCNAARPMIMLLSHGRKMCG
jgi:hypothetical protein